MKLDELLRWLFTAPAFLEKEIQQWAEAVRISGAKIE